MIGVTVEDPKGRSGDGTGKQWRFSRAEDRGRVHRIKHVDVIHGARMP